MWSATKPTEVGRYGWRPSPTELGRPVDIVQPAKTRFAIDATGHVVEGGEWWQGKIYAWEQPVNAELLAAAKLGLARIESDAESTGHKAPDGDSIRAAVKRAEQQPADTRDATIARMRAALERIAKWHGEFPDTGERWPGGAPVTWEAQYGSNGERDYMREVARSALGEKP